MTVEMESCGEVKELQKQVVEVQERLGRRVDHLSAEFLGICDGLIFLTDVKMADIVASRAVGAQLGLVYELVHLLYQFVETFLDRDYVISDNLFG
jgi:hypothetical protein